MENGTRFGRGFTLWFTGLSGAGKTTISEIVEHELRNRFRKIEVLDGDIVRTNLSKGLGFSREDRDTNVLRIGFVADLLTRNGVGVIVSAISPFKEERDQGHRPPRRARISHACRSTQPGLIERDRSHPRSLRAARRFPCRPHGGRWWVAHDAISGSCDGGPCPYRRWD